MSILFILLVLFTWLMSSALLDQRKTNQLRPSVAIAIFVIIFALFGSLFGWVQVVDMLIQNDIRAEQRIIEGRVTSSEIIRPNGHGSEFGDTLVKYRVEASNGKIQYPLRPVIRSDPRQTKNYTIVFGFLGLIVGSVLTVIRAFVTRNIQPDENDMPPN